MFTFIANSLKFFSEHVMLNSFAHTAGGFGLAIILQKYLKSEPFVPVIVGWALLGLSIAIHVYSAIAK